MSLALNEPQARRSRTAIAAMCAICCQLVALACASTAREHRASSSAPKRDSLAPESPGKDAAIAGTASLERSTIVKGASFSYRLSFAEQPNLVYHLDCLSGVALCAEIIFREFWTTRGLDADDQAAIVKWKALRTHYTAEIQRADPSPAEPLLVPSGTFDLAERQRIAGLTASTIDAYQRSI